MCTNTLFSELSNLVTIALVFFFFCRKCWFGFIGSLLVGRTPEESDKLKRMVKQQCEAGLRAEFLSASDLHVKEPELMVDKDTGAAFLPDDSQLNARRAAEFLEKVHLFLRKENQKYLAI